MKNMLGLGLDRSQFLPAVSLIKWTTTSNFGITTPHLVLTGARRNVVINVYIDNANDWTGDIDDYDIRNFTIVNETDSVTHNHGDHKFSTHTSLAGFRVLQEAGYNTESLVSAGSGDTIRFRFDLTLDGYEDVSLTNTITF